MGSILSAYDKFIHFMIASGTPFLFNFSIPDFLSKLSQGSGLGMVLTTKGKIHGLDPEASRFPVVQPPKITLKLQD